MYRFKIYCVDLSHLLEGRGELRHLPNMGVLTLLGFGKCFGRYLLPLGYAESAVEAAFV